MPAVTYSGSIGRTLTSKLGERISVLDFGAVGDGVTDDAPAFNLAIQSAIDKGRGVEIYCPGATYALASDVVFPAGCVPLTIAGDGLATMFKRTGTITAGHGLFDLQGCTDIEFRAFVVDGDVTASTGVLYSTVAGDPMLAALTANTSFWLHEGCARIRFRGVTIQHTGGYAILIDCAAGLIEDVRILDCLFQNNRPHLFGTSGGDLNYGSWTGGVYVNGDGSVNGDHKVLRNFLVRDCTFRRCTGNCLWSHLAALNELHSNFRWCGNHFEDIGLDGMGVNGVSGGVVESNTVRRNGYICSDDTTASTPRYLAGAYSVGLDTAGLVKGVAYKGNSFTSPNGAAMDLDGYAEGIVSGNVARVPVAGEPEYSEDQIASTGPGGGGNISYGAQVSNTNNHSIAGSNIQISGNSFLNLPGGAIRLYATRNSHAEGNQIIHPAGAAIVPITMGNIGAGAYQRAYGNVVTQNRIDYSPAAEAPCVFEDPNGHAFSGGDVNWVYGNRITGGGNAFEFQKDPNTGSVTQDVQSTQAVVTAASETRVERQGSGNGSLTRWYGYEAGTKKLLLDLHHKLYNSTPAVIGGPLWNVSENGGAGTGSISTGARTTLAFDDAVACGRSVVDGFAAFTDATFTYPNDAAADLLPASWGLLRYNSTGHAFEQSLSVSGGHRVWSPLAGAPAGSDTYVQYNNAGAFGASSKFIWNDGAGILGLTGYVQASVGFATTSTATDAIQATLGGVTVKYLIGTVSMTLSTTTAGTAGVAAGRMYFDGSHFFVCEDGSTWARITGSTPAGSDTYVQYNSSGSFAGSSKFIWNDGSGILGLTGYVQASVGFATTSTATDAIQATGGGVTVKYLIGTISMTLSTTSAGTAGVAAGRMYFDGSHFFVCEDGSTWARITGAASVGGSNTQVQYNNSGSFAGSSKFIWNDGSGILGITGYVQASIGFTTTSTATDALQATGGGVTVKYLIGTISMTLSTTSAGTAGAAAGRMYFDGSHFFVCEDGTNWLRITAAYSGGTGISVSGLTITNAGVTSLGGFTGALSLSAGTGIGVSGLTITNAGVTSLGGFTGALSLSAGTGVSVSGLTISIGQAVGTGSGVTFASVTTASGGVIQSGASGGSAAFQTTNFNFQVDGNGNISGAGSINISSYKVGGATVINTFGHFVGPGVDVGSNGISAGGYNVSGGFLGQTVNINMASYTGTLVFKGGVLVSY